MTRFAPMNSTVWTVIHKAHDHKTAFGALVDLYRDPVVRYLRGRGVAEERAQDLAQEVFMRIFEKDLLGGVESSKGRFRSFLFGVTNNILREQLAHDSTRKRGGRTKTVPLDESALAVPVHDEKEFARSWMLHLVRLALKRLSGSTNEKVKRRVEVFRVHAAKKPSYAELAKQFGLTADGVKNALHEARQDLRREVEQLVNTYACSEDDFLGEMAAFDAETDR